jgi:hypothetical protein
MTVQYTNKILTEENITMEKSKTTLSGAQHLRLNREYNYFLPNTIF